MSIRLSQSHRSWSWVVPWLFPLGLVGTLTLISISNVFGYALAMVWGLVLFPHGAAYIHSHPRAPGARNDASLLSEDDMDYWRTKLQ
jgi:hypothetical protein